MATVIVRARVSASHCPCVPPEYVKIWDDVCDTKKSARGRRAATQGSARRPFSARPVTAKRTDAPAPDAARGRPSSARARGGASTDGSAAHRSLSAAQLYRLGSKATPRHGSDTSAPTQPEERSRMSIASCVAFNRQEAARMKENIATTPRTGHQSGPFTGDCEIVFNKRPACPSRPSYVSSSCSSFLRKGTGTLSSRGSHASSNGTRSVQVTNDGHAPITVSSEDPAESVTVRCSAPYPSYGGIDNYPFRDTDKKKWLGRDERDDKARRDFMTAGRPLKLKVDTPINGVGEWIPHPRFQNLTPRGRQQAMASIVKHRGYPQEQWAELRKPRGRGGLARNSNGGRSAGRPMDSTGAAACLSGPETLAPHMKAGRGRTKDASVAHAWLSQGHRR